MLFKVGSSSYRLRIAAGPVTLEGADVIGATVQDDHEILIAARCAPQRRLHVLLRELLRAWSFETGHAVTDGTLDLAATMGESAMADLNTQGGDLALAAMETGQSAGVARVGIGTSRQCARCSGTVAGGSVAWRPGVAPGIAEMRIYCEFCGVTQVWREAVGTRGMPMNIPLGEPVFERGDTTGIMCAGAV